MAMWKTAGDAAGKTVHDDGDIRAALRANDMRRALTLMMNRYGDEVYRFAYAGTHSHHLADEVRQQVFVEVYRDLASFEGRASLRAWVQGITRHRCMDAAKKHRRWTVTTGVEGDPARYTVVYAIVGRSPEGRKLAELLPFFSRVNLYRTAQRLRRIGYKIGVQWVVNPSA